MAPARAEVANVSATMRYEFMSPEWIAAAKAIGEEYEGRVAPVTVAVRINQVITGAPGDHTIDAHLDTSTGRTVIDLGHLEGPDLTITVDYDTAKALFVEQDPTAGMAAFMAGKIRVEGDITRLIALQAQQSQVDPLALEATQRVRDITELPEPAADVDPDTGTTGGTGS